MDEREDEVLEQLLRSLAAAPAAELPSLVRPGQVLAGRFQIERQLGAGGMGRVFAAHDRLRQGTVALKVLGRLTPSFIVRLKREFRSVAELVHPNLVRCHELFSDGVEWFFTMDLIDGATLSEVLDRSEGAQRWDAIRHVFRQLALALTALHEAGVVHADLKPSNFLITHGDRRVVLFDFGLARPIGVASARDGIGGTPGYMAPEQTRGQALTEAVDWYAFGVVLHRALTGRLPSPDGAASLADAPEDLQRLCLDLLQDDPASRPQGPEVQQRIGWPAERSGAPAPHHASLIGREEELARLQEALGAALEGQPSVVLVSGPAGIGKTSLAAAFLGEARERGALVLGSRCRERESMAYKAVDGLVDDLVAALDALPREEASDLLPQHLAELTVLFPGLRASRAVARTPPVTVGASDQTVVRLRAIAAFGELLANLRRRAPLVLWIDDLQWSDAESALLIGPVLSGPTAVPLLLVGSCRTAADGAPSWIASAPALAALSAGPMLEALYGDRKLGIPWPGQITLGPLDRQAAERLAVELLPSSAPDGRAAAGHIADEAAGHPLFITELAHAARLAGGAALGSAPATLHELIALRAASLPPEARRLLELCAVAGAPLARSLLRRTLEVGFAEEEGSLAVLKANRLARTQAVEGGDAVDVSHDRIREIVLAGLAAPDRCAHHLALAQVLESRPEAQPDFVATHYEAAGDRARASRFWLLAAEQAERALAFHHAAELYEKAVVDAPLEPEALRALRVRRAEALVNAGKGPAAADVYLETAEASAPDAAVELRRRAAEQLLLSGHIDRGLGVIEQVLRTIGMRGTRSGRTGILSLLAGRLRVRARGLRHVSRGEHQLSREVLAQLDASWTIACSLGTIDFVRGADFQNEHFLLALRAGEPRRLLRALILEASYSATPGRGSERRTAHLLAVAGELSASGVDRTAIAFLAVARGVAAYLQGRLEAALEHLGFAVDLLSRVGARAVLETLAAQRFMIASLFLLGRLRRLGEMVPPLLADAEATGNIYATMIFRTGFSTAVWLARDDVREAQRQLRLARAEWTGGGYQLAHFNMLFGEALIDLYAGDPERALARIREEWPALRQAHLHRIAVVQAQLLQLRAAAAAGAADRAEARGQRSAAWTLRRQARADARRLGRERIRRAAPSAALAEAALEGPEGGAGAVRGRLEQALRGFTAQGMLLYAAAARVRLGEQEGGERGAAEVRSGLDAFEREGVVQPARFVSMLAPGFGSPGRA